MTHMWRRRVIFTNWYFFSPISVSMKYEGIWELHWHHVFLHKVCSVINVECVNQWQLRVSHLITQKPEYVIFNNKQWTEHELDNGLSHFYVPCLHRTFFLLLWQSSVPTLYQFACVRGNCSRPSSLTTLGSVIFSWLLAFIYLHTSLHGWHYSFTCSTEGWFTAAVKAAGSHHRHFMIRSERLHAVLVSHCW